MNYGNEKGGSDNIHSSSGGGRANVETPLSKLEKYFNASFKGYNFEAIDFLDDFSFAD